MFGSSGSDGDGDGARALANALDERAAATMRTTLVRARATNRCEIVGIERDTLEKIIILRVPPSVASQKAGCSTDCKSFF